MPVTTSPAAEEAASASPNGVVPLTIPPVDEATATPSRRTSGIANGVVYTDAATISTSRKNNETYALSPTKQRRDKSPTTETPTTRRSSSTMASNVPAKKSSTTKKQRLEEARAKAAAAMERDKIKVQDTLRRRLDRGL